MPDSTDKPTTPPWGEDFDAERAWTLLQNVRGDLVKAKDDLAAERQARTTAETKLSETDVDGKVTAAEARAQKAERELWTERALRKHEIAEDLVDFLSGDTEEEILAKAERLAKVGKPSDGDKPDEKPGEAPVDESGDKPAESGNERSGDLPGRPQPTLTPGHGGDSPAPFDPEAIATAARKARF